MSATDIHLNFHGGTPASESGVTINNAQGASAGVIFANALQENGAQSGVSLSVATALTGEAANGVNLGADSLIQALNAQGAYSSANSQTFTFNFPLTVESVDILVCAQTTFNDQNAVDYSAVGANTVEQLDWDQTDTGTGDTFTLVGCQPDVNGDIVLSIDNPAGIGFIYHNAFSIRNVQVTGSGNSGSGSLQAGASSVSATVSVTGTGNTLEPIYVALYNSVSPSVPGEVLNSYQGITAGSSFSLLDRAGGSSGWTIDFVRSLTAADNGRLQGASQLLQQINNQGAYVDSESGGAPGQSVITLNCPQNIQSVSLQIPLCTTFPLQDSLDITINPGDASQQQITGFDSSGNTSGAPVSFVGVTPVAGVITIQVDNATNRYVFHNGLIIDDIVTVGESQSLIASPASISATVTVTPGSSQGTVSDSFDGSGSIASHWLAYNPNSAPVAPVRDGGFYRADITDNTADITTWFNGDQGFLHYQPVRFPDGATPNEYEFLGVGVGPFGANFRDNLPYNNGDYAFAGPFVGNPLLGNWLFAVMGHRGGNAQFTIEDKSTTNNVSTVIDEGSNVVGAGVSFCDFRVELHNTGQVLIKFRPVGGSTWTYINNGTGLTPGTPPNLGAAGDTTWLGFVTYGFGTSSVPFTGSFSEFNVIYEEATNQTITGSGSLQAEASSTRGFSLPENWAFGAVISQDRTADAFVDTVAGQDAPVAGDLVSWEQFLRNKANDAITPYPVSVVLDGLYPQVPEEYSPGLFIPSGQYYFRHRFLDQADGLWGAVGSYDVNVSAGADSVPNQFTLISDNASAELSTVYGGSFVVSGTTPGVDLAVNAGGSMEVSSDGVTYGATATVQNGSTVYYRLTSSASYETLVTGSVTINGISDSLNITTRAAVTPTITSQPSSQSVEQGASVSLAVSATNAASYQWYKNGSPVAGQTGATYNFTAELADDGATYYVIITSSEGGTTQSSTATLSVAANAAPTITGSASHSVNEGSAFSASYTISNRDAAAPSLSGADAALFSLVNVSGDVYTLSMGAKDYEAPIDADADNVYQVIINIDDGVNPAASLAVAVSVLDITETFWAYVPPGSRIVRFS